MGDTQKRMFPSWCIPSDDEIRAVADEAERRSLGGQRSIYVAIGNTIGWLRDGFVAPISEIRVPPTRDEASAELWLAWSLLDPDMPNIWTLITTVQPRPAGPVTLEWARGVSHTLTWLKDDSPHPVRWLDRLAAETLRSQP